MRESSGEKSEYLIYRFLLAATAGSQTSQSQQGKRGGGGLGNHLRVDGVNNIGIAVHVAIVGSKRLALGTQLCIRPGKSGGHSCGGASYAQGVFHAFLDSGGKGYAILVGHRGIRSDTCSSIKGVINTATTNSQRKGASEPPRVMAL